MNCKFCSEPCKLVNTKQLSKVVRMVCPNHAHEVYLFYYRDNPFNRDWMFYVPYKGKMWEFSFLYSASGFINFSVGCGELDDDPLAIGTFDDKIISLDFDPGITPENAMQKLATFLVFS